MIAEEHWASKGPVSLFMWRKRKTASPRNRTPIVLVHGSSTSAIPTFDLQVPGQPDYSFMEWLAERDFDVWAMDHEGYGRSTITAGNSDIACGVEDLKAATEVIARESGSERMHFYGLSSGALRVAAFAQAAPERVERIILDAFVWTGEGSPTLAKRKEGVEQFRANNRRPIDHAFIRSIFTRDEPGTTHPAVMEACAESQLSFGDSVPTGTYLDMTTKLPLVDPTKIPASTMIVRGEHDGIATVEDLLEFFRLLPTGDKRFAILPGVAHCTPLGVNRKLMWEAVLNFVS
ncbi:pimeloyl-ACP methyl ester carboxylesterase [Rhodoligotrophos appendicifer]|uniref:alpha/beta hydrolase n=1 Tax=Rhodoligotrophos appendicifer TaxID=987056 RepID=UPI0011859B27|nr:alpha/beta fold hydrolase [Rhodoligotrophos appendicifer]